MTWQKIQAARDKDQVTLYASSTAWEKDMLHRFMSFSTMEAHNFVCRLDRSGAVSGSTLHNMQKAATNLLCDSEQKRDFSRPIAKRATSSGTSQ